MSLLVRHGLITPSISVFDYGCGRGDDLRALAAAGVNASGWDPHFAPDAQLEEADFVNLGFVLNVIESIEERRRALSAAWKLSRRGLVVSTMIVGQVPLDGLRPFGDGYLTSRSTFQKYYQHAELRTFISRELGQDPVALAPGIFLMFRQPEAEQEFLLSRRRNIRFSTSEYRSGRQSKTRELRPELHERIAAVLDELAEFAMYRGRMPHAEEISQAVHAELARYHVSFGRALDLCQKISLNADDFAAVVAERSEDLLVHYALGILNNTKSATRPSLAMVRDIRSFFGSQKELAERALQYLHSLADPKRTASAMTASAEAGVGIMDEEERLVVLNDSVEQMPGALRCFVGCARHLLGELEGKHLVRLDPLRKRVTFFPLNDVRSAFPTINRSIIVDLRRQELLFRDVQQKLVRKSDIFKMSRKSNQRLKEREYRVNKSFDGRIVIEKY